MIIIHFQQMFSNENIDAGEDRLREFSQGYISSFPFCRITIG